MKTQQESDRHNPWKTGVIATGVALGILVTGGLTFAALNEADVFEKQKQTSISQNNKGGSSSYTAPQKPAEDCSRYLSQGTRNSTEETVKRGALGAAVGAGTGAAGGAIADGGDGAGKGAGIGAIVGAVAGIAHSFNESDEREDRANQLYRECLARK